MNLEYRVVSIERRNYFVCFGSDLARAVYDMPTPFSVSDEQGELQFREIGSGPDDWQVMPLDEVMTLQREYSIAETLQPSTRDKSDADGAVKLAIVTAEDDAQ